MSESDDDTNKKVQQSKLWLRIDEESIDTSYNGLLVVNGASSLENTVDTKATSKQVTVAHTNNGDPVPWYNPSGRPQVNECIQILGKDFGASTTPSMRPSSRERSIASEEIHISRNEEHFNPNSLLDAWACDDIQRRGVDGKRVDNARARRAESLLKQMKETGEVCPDACSYKTYAMSIHCPLHIGKSLQG